MGHHSFIQAEGGTLVESRHISNNKWDHGFLKPGKTDLPTPKGEELFSFADMNMILGRIKKTFNHRFQKGKEERCTCMHNYKEEEKEMGAHIDTKKIGMFDHRLKS